MSENCISKEERILKAIKDGGYYSKNGTWNSIITIGNDDILYRERVETIIVREGKDVFLKMKPDGSYYLPGGSTERYKSHVNQAISECEEEARITVKNIKYSGIQYKSVNITPEWIKHDDYEIGWGGTYTKIYVGEYDGKFDGHVNKVDMNNFIHSGKWYPIKYCFKIFSSHHNKALFDYLNNNSSDEKSTTESYISNYFKNKILLHSISKNPDVKKDVINDIILLLWKKYKSLSSTSKIRRERNNPNVKNIFHPITSIEWDDGCSITFTLCFDDKEISPAAVFSTDKYGHLIAIYPNFFKNNRDSQIFYILHEIGHVRLNHTDKKNIKTDIFGNDIMNNYRQNMINKNKVMYTELNADNYAILNGGKVYAILDTINNLNNNLTINNSELMNRYNRLSKKYPDTITESLTKAERDAIPLKYFGIKATRSYPLDTEEHVRSAVILFNKAPQKYKKELAESIYRAIKKFNIDIEIGKDSELYKYK